MYWISLNSARRIFIKAGRVCRVLHENRLAVQKRADVDTDQRPTARAVRQHERGHHGKLGAADDKAGKGAASATGMGADSMRPYLRGMSFAASRYWYIRLPYLMRLYSEFSTRVMVHESVHSCEFIS